MTKKILTIIVYFLLASQCLAGSVQRYSINQTGLIGWWKLDAAGYDDPVVWGWAGSKNLTAVSNPNLTTGHDGRANTALSFDGTADYLALSTVATKVGAVTMATVAAGALFNDTGQDFSPYVGASGASKPYMLVATNTGGKVAWGYIGEEGMGETLGSDVVSGWDFTSGWAAASATINDSNTFTTTAAYGAIYKAPYLTTGKLYKLVVAGTCSIGTFQIIATSPGAGVYITGFGTSYFTAASTGLYLRSSGNGAVVDITTMTVQEVLTLPANTGVKIYSTKTGSVQSYANVESGFLLNSIASYSVYPSDFQITSALSLSCWFNPDAINVATEKPIIGKRQAGTAVDGYMIYQYENDIRFRIDDADVAISTDCLTAGQWYFITGVFDGTTATVYVNAVVGATTDTGTVSDTYYRLRAGYDMTNYVAGSIDDIPIYNRALTATEVQTLFYATARPVIIDQSKSWRIQ